jgi:hypothetical protein
MKFSISFNYECWQQTTEVLAVPVTLSPTEITDIFISHYSCYRYLEILFTLITTSKLVIRTAACLYFKLSEIPGVARDSR